MCGGRGGAVVRLEPRRSNATSFSEMAKIGDKHKLGGSATSADSRTTSSRIRDRERKCFPLVSVPQLRFLVIACVCRCTRAPFRRTFPPGSCRGVHCRPGAAFSTADSSSPPSKAACRLPVVQLQLLQNQEADQGPSALTIPVVSLQLSLFFKKNCFNQRTMGQI